VKSYEVIADGSRSLDIYRKVVMTGDKKAIGEWRMENGKWKMEKGER